MSVVLICYKMVCFAFKMKYFPVFLFCIKIIEWLWQYDDMESYLRSYQITTKKSDFLSI